MDDCEDIKLQVESVMFHKEIEETMDSLIKTYKEARMSGDWRLAHDLLYAISGIIAGRNVGNANHIEWMLQKGKSLLEETR